jgi:hypothetical protein
VAADETQGQKSAAGVLPDEVEQLLQEDLAAIKEKVKTGNR